MKVGIVNLATIVESHWKVRFLIVTTPRCRGECYSFLWIVPLYPWYVPYNVESEAKRYQVSFFESLVWLDLGLNPSLLGHWQTVYPQTVNYLLMMIYLTAVNYLSPRLIAFVRLKHPVCRRRDGFMPFLGAFVQSKMQTVLSKIWTWIVDSISNDYDHYTNSLELAILVYISHG